MNINELKTVPAAERIAVFQSLRETIAADLHAEIQAKEKEKAEALAMYDEEIGELRAKLQSYGLNGPIGSNTEPSEIAVRAYNFLRENVGKRYSGGDLMKHIKSVGCPASVALAPFVANGRIKKSGNHKGASYFVDGM